MGTHDGGGLPAPESSTVAGGAPESSAAGGGAPPQALFGTQTLTWVPLYEDSIVQVVPVGQDLAPSPPHEGAQKLSPWNWAQTSPLQSELERHETHCPGDEPPVPEPSRDASGCGDPLD